MLSLVWPLVAAAVLWSINAQAAPTAISMDDRGLALDGKPISSIKKTAKGPVMLVSLKATEAVLGPCDLKQKIKEGKFSYIWSSCALEMISWNDVILSITVNFSPIDFYPTGSTTPKKTSFNGTVLLDGLHLTKRTRISEIAETLKKEGFSLDARLHEAMLDRGTCQVYVDWEEDQTLKRCFLLLIK